MVLDPQKTALLVIDVQNEYFDGQWPVPDAATALYRIEQAIEASYRAGATVVYIQHEVLRPERGIFLRGTRGFELHPRLQPRPNDPHIVKNYPGAFTKTNLTDVLYEHGINTLIISGYMTHMCCDTTAREAFHRDFQVLFLSDATATRDGHHSTLGSVDHRELHKATLITQASMFSQVVATNELMTMLPAAR